MAVRIRLTRTGAKKRPFYRLVVADSRSPRDRRFIEIRATQPNREPSGRKHEERADTAPQRQVAFRHREGTSQEGRRHGEERLKDQDPAGRLGFSLNWGAGL